MHPASRILEIRTKLCWLMLWRVLKGRKDTRYSFRPGRTNMGRKLNKRRRKQVLRQRNMWTASRRRFVKSGIWWIVPMITLFVQQMKNMKSRCRRFLKSCMSREIFTKGLMKDFIVRLASRFGRSLSLWMENVRTAGARWSLRKKKRISLRWVNMRTGWLIIWMNTQSLYSRYRGKMKWWTIFCCQGCRICAFQERHLTGGFR